MKTAAHHLAVGSAIPARVALRAPSTPRSLPSAPTLGGRHRQAPCGTVCEPRGGRGTPVC